MKSLVDISKNRTGAADFSATPVGVSEPNVDGRDAFQHVAGTVHKGQDRAIKIERSHSGRHMQIDLLQLTDAYVAICNDQSLSLLCDRVFDRRCQNLTDNHFESTHEFTPVGLRCFSE
ncbi:MAG: hypothetical protein RLZZ360_976 [Candidatus Parcubacteria bacterium]